jgi:hypothetical protein
MPLTLGICKVLLRYPGRRHPHANAFSLEPSFLEEALTPMAHVNAGRPRTVRTPASEDATITAVELEPRRGDNSGCPISGSPKVPNDD